MDSPKISRLMVASDTSAKLLESINIKLDKIITLVAISAVHGLGEIEQMKTLRYAGWKDDQIAEFMGVSTAVVRTRLYRFKKSQSGPQKVDK